jgi:hypothetical protein
MKTLKEFADVEVVTPKSLTGTGTVMSAFWGYRGNSVSFFSCWKSMTRIKAKASSDIPVSDITTIRFDSNY